MDAIHVNWTRPRINGGGIYFAEDFDILTTILSALKWREKNGRIKLATDTEGYKFYESRGMADIWDEISTELDSVPGGIDPRMFWAAGKLFALRACRAPIAVLDTDFIVWDKLAFENFAPLTVIHREELSPEIYPDRFNMRDGYGIPRDFNMRSLPSNAAFYVIKSDKLIQRYTSEAIKFMTNAACGDDLTYMVFAEQRMLSMAAEAEGCEIMALSTLERLFDNGERCFTHTWGMKRQMREQPQLRRDFCRRCADRIIRDFPERKQMLRGIREISYLFEK